MKRFKKAFFAVLMSLMMVLSLVSCSSTTTIKKDVNTADGPYAGKTIILHTNDSHGGLTLEPNEDPVPGLEGYSVVSFVKKDFESKGATVILVDDGDFSQGKGRRHRRRKVPDLRLRRGLCLQLRCYGYDQGQNSGRGPDADQSELRRRAGRPAGSQAALLHAGRAGYQERHL